MKKNYLLSLLFVLITVVHTYAQSQPVDPVFTAVTNKAEGEFVKIYLTSEDYFWVDWGDGTTKRYEKGAYGECNPLYPENGLKGNEINIYGDDVTYIIANDCAFTSVEAYLTNNPLWLEVSNNPLETLNLDNCSMLETLIADNCGLTNLQLGMKKKLHTLEVPNNKLTTIDISKCSNLQTVNISYNNIEGSITLPSSLTQIDASDNNLTAVDCTKSKKIEYLTLRKNQIQALDLSDISSLMMCDASYNQIKDVQFSGKYEYITTILLKSNKLESADFSSLTDIHAIDISDNNFTTVDITKNKALTSFTADNNQLTDINLTNNSDINFLYLCGNKLKNIDVSSLVYLHDFRVDNNMLEEITMPQSPDLICVMLTNNNLETKTIDNIIEVLPDVTDAYVYEWEKDWKQHLNLSGNVGAPYADLSKAEAKGWVVDVNEQDKPVEMKGFEMTLGKKDNYEFYVAADAGTKVQMVSATNEILSEGIVDASEGIVLLHFASFITSDEEYAKVRLQADDAILGIYAVAQKIKDIDFTGYSDVVLLNISDNDIESLDVSSLVSLYELVCSGNKISNLNIGTNNIKSLDCSNNNLTISTLPMPENITSYVYAPQKVFAIAYDDSGVLDLSEMYIRNNIESKFGVEGEDGKEYIENIDYTSDKGVISFLKPLGKVCVTVENATFPALTGADILRSIYFEVTVSSGINEVTIDNPKEVYDLMGRKLVNTEKKGIYIINGHKVVVK